MVEAAKTDELRQITNPAITAHLYLAIWLKAQRIELAPLTRLSYGQVFRLHINPKLGHWRLTHLRGFALEFAGGENIFPFKSIAVLWITAENPV